MKLYELANDIRNLDSIEDEDELKSALESLGYEFRAKAVNIGKFIKELQSDQQAIDNEITRLSQIRKASLNKTNWLINYLETNMIQSGIDKIDGAVVKLTIRTNPPSCLVSDVTVLPDKYKRHIPESWDANKTEILKLFKETGEMLPGTTIITDKKRLEIR